jgi:hypothetical protein
MPHLHKLLPKCRHVEIVLDVDHGLVVWSHPGPSGLDPRATGALALVRIADGIAGGLDEPVSLPEALRWLLEGDITDWLLRRQHRVYASRCLLERRAIGDACLTHPSHDPELEAVGRALGGTNGELCHVALSDPPWQGPAPAPAPAPLAKVGRAALAVTYRLAGWYAVGVTGSVAWDLARHGVQVEAADRWCKAGFSLDEIAVWAPHGSLGRCSAMRESGYSPVGPMALPAPSVKPKPGSRGITGFVLWKMSNHGRRPATVACKLCDAPDYKSPCRTCVSERRTHRIHAGEWRSYIDFAKIHIAFVAGDPGPAVACGHGSVGRGPISREDVGPA